MTDWLDIRVGDCRDILKALPDESVHCVVTSPPYWSLRDYGVPGQLGLEPTPEAFVAGMVEVFREVRRVLRRDGTLWLNMGDGYANDTKWGGSTGGKHVESLHGATGIGRQKVTTGLKPKDLIGMPWRLAFALQADGWYLRSDIIWAKPNPMPESVTDRPTKSHEYVFLLSKSARYFYDAEAVREPHTAGNTQRQLTPDKKPQGENGARGSFYAVGGERYLNPAGRNLRDVWTIATQPYPGAHFATFPQKLVEPCIKAGTSERGVCPECGAPWVREVEVERGPMAPERGGKNYGANAQGTSPTSALRKTGGDDWYAYAGSTTTTGWRPSCQHTWPDGSTRVVTETPIPATVLDPFAGSGTTGLVANRLSRRAILIELSEDYVGQLLHRNRQTPLGLLA